MDAVVIYTTRWCGFCSLAKELLTSKDIAYTEIDVTDDPRFRQTVYDATGGWTVPQVIVRGENLGGYSELHALERSGRLTELLERAQAHQHPG